MINRNKNSWRERPLNDLTGKSYHYLTVVGFSHYKERPNKNGRVAYWLCKCICGNTKVLIAGNLKNGFVKSCGCRRHEHMSALHKKAIRPDAVINRLYSQYKSGAKKVDRIFELTKAQFVYFTGLPCNYCGINPSSIKTINCKNFDGERTFIYNGIDRIDNKKGYIMDNCISCCRDCNVAKGTKSLTEFMEWMGRLIENQKLSAIKAPIAV